jgi:predicted nucleic acid-binding protein
VLLDTNILISALISSAGNPAIIYNAREDGKFTMLSCAEHLDECEPRCKSRESLILSSLILPAAWSTK